jgi:hypothetical protein
MLKVYIKFFVLLLFLVIYSNIIAQDACTEKLKVARQLFESGQIEQIPSLLDSCILNGFNKEQKIQAYHLLMQTYLFDYNQDKAGDAMMRFLKEFPNYKFKANDALEVKELYKDFEVLPNWGFGLTLGTNFSVIQPTQYFSVSNLNILNSKYGTGLGLHAGLNFEKYFGKHFGIAAGAKYSGFTYKNTEDISSSTRIEYTEKAKYLSFPLSFYFVFGSKKRVSPFLFTGAEYCMFQDIQSDTKKTIQSTELIYEKNGRDILDLRNKNLIWVRGGMGLQYKLNNGSIKFWTGFNYNLNQFILKDKRYSDFDYIINYQHIDDDIFVHQIFINITYSWLLYKIKHKKTDVQGN